MLTVAPARVSINNWTLNAGQQTGQCHFTHHGTKVGVGERDTKHYPTTKIFGSDVLQQHFLCGILSSHLVSP